MSEESVLDIQKVSGAKEVDSSARCEAGYVATGLRIARAKEGDVSNKILQKISFRCTKLGADGNFESPSSTNDPLVGTALSTNYALQCNSSTNTNNVLVGLSVGTKDGYIRQIKAQCRDVKTVQEGTDSSTASDVSVVKLTANSTDTNTFFADTDLTIESKYCPASYAATGFMYYDDSSSYVKSIRVLCEKIVDNTCDPTLVDNPYCSTCGDGKQGQSEVCDKGTINVDPTSLTCSTYNKICEDLCTNDCLTQVDILGPYCGDGRTNGSEECDDGNTTAGDGCVSCKVEEEYNCCSEGYHLFSEKEILPVQQVTGAPAVDTTALCDPGYVATGFRSNVSNYQLGKMGFVCSKLEPDISSDSNLTTAQANFIGNIISSNTKSDCTANSAIVGFSIGTGATHIQRLTAKCRNIEQVVLGTDHEFTTEDKERELVTTDLTDSTQYCPASYVVTGFRYYAVASTIDNNIPVKSIQLICEKIVNKECDSNTKPYCSKCGDGTQGQSEVCDKGTSNVDSTSLTCSTYGGTCKDLCTTDCSTKIDILGPYCGDGRTNGLEECDDGNTIEEDGCSGCVIEPADLTTSGSTTTTAAAADSTTPVSTTTTAAQSTATPVVSSVCGDGSKTGTEVCDDGNTTTETACPYGETTCTACSSDCKTSLTALQVSYCGDGSKTGTEVCDDGNTTTETACPYGSPTCRLCNADCSKTLTSLVGNVCGDNDEDEEYETCDDGDTDKGDGCSEECQQETAYYVDNDADGYGKNGSTARFSVENQSGYVTNSSDCDDNSASITTTSWYKDGDGDGYGDSSSTTVLTQCTDPSTSALGYYAKNKTDCNDSKNDIYPGSTAKGCGVDTNCDGTLEDSSCTILYNSRMSKQTSGAVGDELSLTCGSGKIMAGCTCYQADGGCSRGAYMENKDGTVSCKSSVSIADKSVKLMATCLTLGARIGNDDYVSKAYDIKIASGATTTSSTSSSGAISDATCENGYTMTSCGCYSANGGCVGGSMLTIAASSGKPTCRVYQLSGYSSAQARATCLKIPSLTKLTSTTVNSGTPTNASLVNCGTDPAILTGCSCFPGSTTSDYCKKGADFKTSTIDGKSITACYAYGSSTLAYGLCLKNYE